MAGACCNAIKGVATVVCSTVKGVATAVCSTVKGVAKDAWGKATSYANCFLKKIKRVANFLWRKLQSMNGVTAAVISGLGVLAFGVFTVLRAVIPGFGIVAKVISNSFVGRRVMGALFGFIFRDAYGEDPVDREERMQSFACDLLMLCISFLLFLLFEL